MADRNEAKYGSEWHFDVRDGAFVGPGATALVFAVSPTTAFGFRRGNYGQTHRRFPAPLPSLGPEASGRPLGQGGRHIEFDQLPGEPQLRDAQKCAR